MQPQQNDLPEQTYAGFFFLDPPGVSVSRVTVSTGDSQPIAPATQTQHVVVCAEALNQF